MTEADRYHESLMGLLKRPPGFSLTAAIPFCFNCYMWEGDHLDGQCLFSPTKFKLGAEIFRGEDFSEYEIKIYIYDSERPVARLSRQTYVPS